MLEILVVFILILLNGFFSMAEISVIASRKAKLETEAKSGKKGAKSALFLLKKPARFLSTVQAGITLVGILIGAYSGAKLSDNLAPYLAKIPFIAPFSYTLAYILVVVIVTYLILVFGELVPKRIAMNFPESVAMLMSPVVRAFSVVSAPFVFILAKSTESVVKLMGIKNVQPPPITDEEITALIREGTISGQFEKVEQEIVERLFLLGDTIVGALMQNKVDIVALDIAEGEQNKWIIASSNFNIYPVFEEHLDNIIGIVRTKDILSRFIQNKPFNLREVLIPPFYVPDTQKAFTLLEQFKKTRNDYAIVIDEFSTFVGIITLRDLAEGIFGDVDLQSKDPEIVETAENTWLVDGLIDFEELLCFLDLKEETVHKENDFRTLSGFISYFTGHIASTGETFIWHGFVFEVLDLDGLRVDKVRIIKTIPKREKGKLGE